MELSEYGTVKWFDASKGYGYIEAGIGGKFSLLPIHISQVSKTCWQVIGLSFNQSQTARPGGFRSHPHLTIHQINHMSVGPEYFGAFL